VTGDLGLEQNRPASAQKWYAGTERNYAPFGNEILRFARDEHRSNSKTNEGLRVAVDGRGFRVLKRSGKLLGDDS